MCEKDESMLRCDHRKHIRLCFSSLLLLFFAFTFPATPRSGEKTPPFYPEENRKGSEPDSKSDMRPPVKEFPDLFPSSAGSSSDQKTAPYYGEGEKKASQSLSKPDRGDLTEQKPPMDDGTFQTEEYVVKEGDWLVKILREKGLMNERNLPELLSLLRKLNASLHSLDMIQPGEKIIILVKVVPGSGAEEKGPRKLRYETYRVKQGDILSRVAMGRYGLSKEQFNREYLRLFAETNPSIKDPNILSVGQIINLPHYPPEHVKTEEKPSVMRDLEKSSHQVAMKSPTPTEWIQPRPPETSAVPKTPPVEPVRPRPEPTAKDMPPPAKPAPVLPQTTTSASGRGGGHLERDREATIIVADGLGNVISRMGEEWVHSGEHFIPMTSGGHILLDAESYPIIRLQHGITVIVDVHNGLPQKMARVLESTWANYRVVRLSASDDLRSALDKVLNAFNYPKILKGNAPLKLGGSIPVSITGDWIITAPETPSRKGPKFVVINLLAGHSSGLPRTLKNYLKLIGVEVIEYPSAEEVTSNVGAAAPTVQTVEDPAAAVAAILNLRGQPFTTQVNIPAYATRNEDFKFTVQADFYLEIGGRRHVIDLEGLHPDVVSLLKDKGISVLSLTQTKEPVNMISRVLEFLNVHFDRGPHMIMAKRGDASRNVTLTLPGITFHDHNGNSVLATSVNLPPEIVAFLSQRGYHILLLSSLSPSGSGSA